MSDSGEYCRKCYSDDIGCRDCARADLFTRGDVAALREAIEVIDGEWGMNVPNGDGTTTRCLPERMEKWNLASILARIEAAVSANEA